MVEQFMARSGLSPDIVRSLHAMQPDETLSQVLCCEDLTSRRDRDSINDEYAVITNVPECGLTSTTAKLCYSHYDYVSKTLIIMANPSMEHGLPSGTLLGDLYSQAVARGFPHIMSSTSVGATHGSEQKTHDCCLYVSETVDCAGHDSGWPVLVIETAVSESTRKIRRDARWWLACRKVPVVLTLIVSAKYQRVTCTRWRWSNNGAEEVDRAMSVEFVGTDAEEFHQEGQELDIIYEELYGRDPPHHLEDGTLTIKFELLQGILKRLRERPNFRRQRISGN